MKRKDEKTKKKLCPSISWINREGGQSPLVSLPVKNWDFTITSQYFSHAVMPFLVHGSIFWCPRRRGTTQIHPEFGG
jgi:hypothetical protein